MLFALLLLGIVGPSRNSILIVIVIVYTPIVARVVRSVVLSVKVRGFVEAARLQGEPQAFILFQKSCRRSCRRSSRSCPALLLCHLPGRFAWFPGCGRAAPNPDWGLMVKEARNYVSQTPWALYFPAAAIATVVIGVNLMADGLKWVWQEGAGRLVNW